MIRLFNRLFSNIGIDLGTANTVVYVAGKGFIVNEPSVIAYKSENEIICVGAQAKQMLGKTHSDITVIRPLADGVIADFIAGEAMVKSFIKLAGTPSFFINNVVIGIPTGITSVEKRAVVESAELAGGRHVFLITEPMAAAIGVGLNVLGSSASMIIDIGGGTTDIAVINYGGIVVDNTIRIAGDEMNEAIMRHLKQKHHLKIGISTAERLKIEYGTLLAENKDSFSVNGLDTRTGLPTQLEIDSSLFRDALKDILGAIADSVLQCLDRLPPELAADIIERGIILTGGGSLLEGLDHYIRELVNLPVSRPGNPLLCVAEGTRKVLENFELYRPVLGR